jgi:Zn finger protein HypA/HybF involved in hydrogenase expression
MHEYGIARDLVQRAVAEAQGCGASRITTLHLAVGSLESLDRDALAFGVQAAAHDTIAEGVAVVISKAEGKGIVLEDLEIEEMV